MTTETGVGDEAEYEDEEEDEENEEDVDEYEEELREVAESHEAMSRDDRRNSTSGINHSEVSVTRDDIRGTRNFDSHEKSVEESSDESMTSNEAISGETQVQKEKSAEVCLFLGVFFFSYFADLFSAFFNRQYFQVHFGFMLGAVTSHVIVALINYKNF